MTLPSMDGIKVSSASPMFILPECTAAGTFAYPDYRFYYTCISLEGSSLYFTQTLWQCPTGLFFNSMYRTCGQASTFSGHQVKIHQNYENIYNLLNFTFRILAFV